jgi:hypothetical protein
MHLVVGCDPGVVRASCTGPQYPLPIHTYIRTYVHTYIRTYVRTHTRTHTHTHEYCFMKSSIKQTNIISLVKDIY